VAPIFTTDNPPVETTSAAARNFFTIGRNHKLVGAARFPGRDPNEDLRVRSATFFFQHGHYGASGAVAEQLA